MNGFQEGTEAVEYYRRIMTPDDVMMIKSLWKKIYRIPSAARRCLQEHCRTLQELEDFFKDNSYSFHVENGRVALYDEDLETAGDLAEKYFKEKLEECEGPLHFMALKKKYLKDAPDIVGNLITRFYPGKEFKHFLKSRPDSFVLLDGGKVFLTEVETVAYFERRLEVFGRDDLRFTSFKGHITQAPKHVREYINRNYPGNDFELFLRKHSDVFQVSEEGYVSLVPLD